MSNDTIIVSILTIFIVKNSRYIAKLSGKLSGMDDNFYEAGATVAGTEESYYAVELCCEDFNGLELIPAYKDSTGVHKSEN